MPDSKDSALPLNTTPLLTDQVRIVDDPATNPASERMAFNSLLGDGWLNPGETWVYVSATSFKIVGVDVTARYQTGRKLRCKQGGGYKYFYVVSSAFVTDTTVTITGGLDYSLANATITDNYFSYVGTPGGFPEWFNYTPTGVAASNVTLTGRFRVSGRHVFGKIHMAFTGAITFTTMPTLPITAAAGLTTYDDGDADLAQAGEGGYFDSGTATVLGTIFPSIPSSATVVTITTSAGADMSATVPITWASGDALSIQFHYEI